MRKIESEADLQDMARKHLMCRGWLVNKIIQCSNNGWADLEAFKKGECIFIEVKKPGKKNDKPLQLFRQKQLTDRGFRVFSVECFEDIGKLP